MKKNIQIALLATAPVFANAQNGSFQSIDKEVFNILSVIFTVGLFMVFILALIKRFMDHRIKNKIIDKGIPENFAASVLQQNPNENRNLNIKWFSLLAGIGVALTIIHYTLPLGIHSLAIMCFCVAASFLGYFWFLKQAEK
jgi:hypothetical protein